MSISHLINEDDEFVYLYVYLHNDSDKIPKWIFDNPGKYTDKVELADHYVAYELRLDYKIHKVTGEVTYISIK